MTTDHPHTLPAPDVPPPARYPFEDWAPAGTEYDVPEHLRGYYAAIVIPASLEAHYRANGGTLTVAAVYDHDAAIDRAERYGHLRGGVLRSMGELICEPDDYVKEYGRADQAPLYRVTEFARVSAEDGIQAWRHAIRLQYATAGHQSRLDGRRSWTAQLCRSCGQHASHQQRDGGLGHVCDGCFDLYQKLRIEQQLIGGHTRLERVQAWLAETTAPVASPAPPTPIAAGEKPQQAAPKRSAMAVAS
jgi:hypothetical protein